MKILIAGIPQYTANYEHALTLCGADFDTTLYPADLSSYDRLLLPGGGDIHPSWFGQEDQGSRSVDPELDRLQFRLLLGFLQAKKPVLGICRGLQIINVGLGGSLIQDLPTADGHRFDGRDQLHTVRCSGNSLLYRLYGGTCLVNSAHHQGLGRIAAGFDVTQAAPDGVVEAIEHRTEPVLGVQWHPERTDRFPPHTGVADGGKLIRYFAERM